MPPHGQPRDGFAPFRSRAPRLLLPRHEPLPYHSLSQHRPMSVYSTLHCLHLTDIHWRDGRHYTGSNLQWSTKKDDSGTTDLTYARTHNRLDFLPYEHRSLKSSPDSGRAPT